MIRSSIEIGRLFQTCTWRHRLLTCDDFIILLSVRKIRQWANGYTLILGPRSAGCRAEHGCPTRGHIYKYSIIIIGIQPLGRFGQRPELSQATGMALVHCILGKVLRVVCHCFPPRLDVPTFATRCLHVRHGARDPSGGRWNCGRECCPVILPK